MFQYCTSVSTLDYHERSSLLGDSDLCLRSSTLSSRGPSSLSGHLVDLGEPSLYSDRNSRRDVPFKRHSSVIRWKVDMFIGGK